MHPPNRRPLTSPALHPHPPNQYGELRQGYDKDTTDTRQVFYGMRYILEHYVARRWTLQARLLAAQLQPLLQPLSRSCRAAWSPAQLRRSCALLAAPRWSPQPGGRLLQRPHCLTAFLSFGPSLALQSRTLSWRTASLRGTWPPATPPSPTPGTSS